jgi:hypothetical protein
MVAVERLAGDDRPTRGHRLERERKEEGGDLPTAVTKKTILPGISGDSDLECRLLAACMTATTNNPLAT